MVPLQEPKLWLVRGDCGDVYCGCGGGHILGVATSADEASRIEEEAHTKESYGRKRWAYGIHIEEIRPNSYDPPHTYDKEGHN